MSNDFRRFDEEDEDEDDIFANDDELDHFAFKKNAILFAIDASETMRGNGKDGNPLSAAINAVAQFMQVKIKESSDTDKIGLLFFGVEKSNNNPGVNHVFLHQDLDLPDVHRITHLEKLVNDHSAFVSSFGTPASYSIADVFWVCNDLFSRLKNHSRQLVFITNQDKPPLIEDKHLETQAHVRFRDLRQLGCEFELFAIRPSSQTDFDFDRFYTKLPMFLSDEHTTEEEEEENQLRLKSIPADNSFEQLKEKMKTKESRKRTAFRVPFHIGKDLTIGVKGYNLFLRKKRPSHFYMETSSNREVQSNTVTVCQTTGLRLNPVDLKYYYVFGGEKAIFSKDELAKMRSFGEPGMTLLGFKPKSSLKTKHNLKSSVFIVPDENQYIGSHSLFAHLHERMHFRDKIAICTLISRKTSLPRLVALFPSNAEALDSGPYGFHAILLPFGDDLRHIPADPAKDVDTRLVEVAKKVVDAVQLPDFDFSTLPNPSLERYFSVVESLALDRDDVPDIDDKTLPDADHIIEKAGSAIELFNEISPEEEAPVATSRKRAPVSSSAGSASKRSKTVADDGNVYESAKLHYQQGNLGKLTVPQLKEALSSAKIAPKGKKADLVQQLEAHFSST